MKPQLPHFYLPLSGLSRGFVIRTHFQEQVGRGNWLESIIRFENCTNPLSANHHDCHQLIRHPPTGMSSHVAVFYPESRISLRKSKKIKLQANTRESSAAKIGQKSKERYLLQSKPRCGAWQYVHQFLFLTREEVPRLTVTWTRELERRQKPGRWSPGGWRSCGERAKVLSTFTFRPAVLFNLFTFTFHPAVFFICVFPV